MSVEKESVGVSLDNKKRSKEWMIRKLSDQEAIRKNTIEEGHRIYERKYLKKWYAKPRAIISMASMILFVMLLNMSPVFAEGMSEIPVIKYLAQVFTFREYESKNESSNLVAEIPKLENTGNEKFEEKINQLIEEKMEELRIESEEYAKDFRENFLAMEGNKEEDFKPFDFELTYEVKSVQEEVVSFCITCKEKAWYNTIEKYFYNYDIKTGKELTLEELLGKSYKEVIDTQIEAQILERDKVEEYTYSYYEKFYKTPTAGIEANQPFYINEDGKVVIYFDSIIIAPAEKGPQEFIIESPILE